jgi:hypothetical protein
MEKMKTERGFFVQYKDGTYSSPHDSLNDARADARVVGPDLAILHGILKYTDSGTVDPSELYLVPKTQKE